MKSLLEFYKESIRLDPKIDIVEITTDYCAKINKFNNVVLLRSIYSRALSDIQFYHNLETYTGYFTPINGNKVIMCKDYVGNIDPWFPIESNLFNLTSPILSGWLITEIIEEGGFTKIEEVIQYPTLLDQVLCNLKKTLIGTTVWGFWLGDQRRGIRERGIKIRELVIKEVDIPTPGHNTCPLSILLEDKREKVNLNFKLGDNYIGWNFYLSKELLSDKLKELEVLWIRNYDSRVRRYDLEIKKKMKELKFLKSERNKFENGIEEFREKIHQKLWKSF